MAAVANTGSLASGNCMTVHNQLPVTYFSNFFVLTNLLEGESQIQQETVSWWPPLFQPCMNISFSPGSGAFEKQHNWKSSHFSTSSKNLSFFFFVKDGKKRTEAVSQSSGWRTRLQRSVWPQRKPPLEAFSSSPQNKKTPPRSGPGHQSGTYGNKSSADHWPCEADENGSTVREEKWVPFWQFVEFQGSIANTKDLFNFFI